MRRADRRRLSARRGSPGEFGARSAEAGRLFVLLYAVKVLRRGFRCAAAFGGFALCHRGGGSELPLRGGLRAVVDEPRRISAGAYSGSIWACAESSSASLRRPPFRCASRPSVRRATPASASALALLVPGRLIVRSARLRTPGHSRRPTRRRGGTRAAAFLELPAAKNFASKWLFAAASFGSEADCLPAYSLHGAVELSLREGTWSLARCAVSAFCCSGVRRHNSDLRGGLLSVTREGAV